MAHPGFSERAFEFAFNAEICAGVGAIACGLPHIPSQSEEHWLGYDVAFEFKSASGKTRCLALQHKVSHFASKLAWNNKQFWDKMDKLPYYRFAIDVEQYNLIQFLASLNLPGIHYRYSAPGFHALADLQARYLAKAVVAGSVFIDIRKSSPLAAGVHNMVYRPGKPSAYAFSAPQEVSVETATNGFVGDVLSDAALDKTLENAFRMALSKSQDSVMTESQHEEWDRLIRRYDRVQQLGKEGFGPKLSLLGIILGRYFNISLLAKRSA